VSQIRTTVVLVAAAALVAGLSGCAGDPAPGAEGSDGAPVQVAASFYPVQWLAEQVGGPAVEVVSLTPEGVEPHDVALDAGSLEAVAAADAVLYLGAGFQPDVERAVADAGDGTVTADLLQAEGIELLAADAGLGKEPLQGGKDPHVWLDPVLMAAMVPDVVDALSEADPDGADGYRQRGEQVTSALEELDGDLGSQLTDCEVTTIVTSHAAFGYLADRYGLEQLPIAGVSPDDQPSAATLKEIAAAASEAGVTTVFFEDVLPPDLAETVASEIGADVDLLSALEFDPAASIGPDEDYLSVMRDNGRRLNSGLTCA
jgi:zinc transport system substrate-binding protein